MEKKKYPLIRLFQKEIITRTGDEEKKPYMIRWIIFQTKWASLFIHKFLLPDNDCLHDHPWPFISFIIKGGYWEWCRADAVPLEEWAKISGSNKILEQRTGPTGRLEIKRWFGAGSFLRRPADWLHRVVVDKPCLTVVMTFKVKRKWGFMTADGWKHHTEYNSTMKCD